MLKEHAVHFCQRTQEIVKNLDRTADHGTQGLKLRLCLCCNQRPIVPMPTTLDLGTFYYLLYRVFGTICNLPVMLRD